MEVKRAQARLAHLSLVIEKEEEKNYKLKQELNESYVRLVNAKEESLHLKQYLNRE